MPDGAVITENLVCMPTPAAAGTDRGYLEAAGQDNGVLFREAACKKKAGVGMQTRFSVITTVPGLLVLWSSPHSGASLTLRTSTQLQQEH